MLVFLVIGKPGFSQPTANIQAIKNDLIQSISSHEKELITLSDQIWALAETALEEHESAKLLADYAEKQGFEVRRNIAGMPTAFVATFGSGQPIIGILGEFDALPGISQKAQPNKEVLKEGAAGHGCGHNLFGAGSLGAALAIKEAMQRGQLKGTIRFYGTPAEEKIFGKLYLAREGMFNDLDVCLDWHPSADTRANVQSSQALVDFTVEFNGRAAHAAVDPWNGYSALDGLEFYTNALNYLREHVQPTVRIHYVIQNGGEVANVVPDYTRVWTRIRDAKREGMLQVFERAKEIARGASIMAGVSYEIKLMSGLYELLINRTGAAVLQKNLELLGPISYTPEEIEFAKEIQKATGKDPLGLNGSILPLEVTRDQPNGGSTDVGDISWIVPEISLAATTAPIGTPWHSWPVVACAGMSIGHKGMALASKALALTMADLFTDENLRKKIRIEFEERRGDHQYKALLPDGPPPVPKMKKQED